jgi:hypothetical protein
MSLIIVLTNKSNLAPISDYDYRVLVGDGTKERSTLITEGKVEGHRRDDGWKKLVYMMLEKEDPV